MRETAIKCLVIGGRVFFPARTPPALCHATARHLLGVTEVDFKGISKMTGYPMYEKAV